MSECVSECVSAEPTCMLGVVCRNLLSSVLGWGMLQGVQLSPEGSELLPLLRAPEGSFLSRQPDCCVVQLSLQACTKVGCVMCQ